MRNIARNILSYTQYCVILHSNKRMYNFLYSIYNCIKTDKIRKKIDKATNRKINAQIWFYKRYSTGMWV